MTIVELTLFENLTNWTNSGHPYVYSTLPSGYQLAPYWINIFGAPDTSNNRIVRISSVVRDSLEVYDEVFFLNDCNDQEKTYFFDFGSQELYIHFEHDIAFYEKPTFQAGIVNGYSDQADVYIDNIYYQSLVQSVPSAAQSQDIFNYNKLSFVSGTIVLDNSGGVLDDFRDRNIYGNKIFIKSLDYVAGQTDYTSSDATDINAFFVDDWGFVLDRFNIEIQDIRKSQNVDIPTEKFSLTDYPDIDEDLTGQVIPLIYGQLRETEAIKTNGTTISGTVSYRSALLMTSFGTVQVDIDGIWTTVSTATASLSTGEFTLTSANGRDSSGAVRDCRLQNSTGIAITYTSDIIKDLNLRYLGTIYNSSNYDTTEWESEELSLTSGGIRFDTEIKLFEAIRQVQAGSVIGFRYDILPNGRRTFRIDDYSRAISKTVMYEDIKENLSLPITTDRDLVAAIVNAKYAKSYNSGKFLSTTNSDNLESVRSNYKQENTITVETLLNNLTDANSRAQNDAEKLNFTRPVTSLTFMGQEFLTMRIYDTVNIVLSPADIDLDAMTYSGRKYFGVWKMQVIGTNPDSSRNNNKVKLIGIEELVLSPAA